MSRTPKHDALHGRVAAVAGATRGAGRDDRRDADDAVADLDVGTYR
jgi:hypothetical protein